MIENAHWYWDASTDAHGSTVSKLTIEHPGQSLNPTFMTNYADETQWTKVSTFPTRVVNASQTYNLG
jgi:hypothetical protein